MKSHDLLTKGMILLVGLFGPMLVLASAQMVPLAILLALVSSAMLLKDRPAAFRIHWPLLTVAAITVLYVASADLWTPLGENAERALRAGLLLLAGALIWTGLNRLDDQAKAKCATALLIGMAFVLAWLIAERFSDNWLLRQLSEKPNLDVWSAAYNRGLNVLAVIGPVLSGILWRRNRVLAVAVGLLPFAVNFFMGVSTTAILAAAVGALAAALAMWRAKLVAAALAVGLFAGALFGPALLRDPETLAPAVTAAVESEVLSFQHRLATWHYTSTMIADRPLLGWGARAARDLPDAGLDIYTYADRIAAPWPPFRTVDHPEQVTLMPLHPHNALLQARLELGLIGTLLLLVTVSTALSRAVLTLGRTGNAALIGSIAAAVTVWCLSVGLWQSWWIATLGVAFALTRLVPEENS